MMMTFRQAGISLNYPSDWTLQSDGADSSGWTISINSPAISFMMISLMTDVQDQLHIADEALQSLVADYSNLESIYYTGTIANHPAIGYDIDFFTVDQVSAAQIRVIDTIHGCILFLLQSTEYDQDTSLPVMIMILDSVTIDD